MVLAEAFDAAQPFRVVEEGGKRLRELLHREPAVHRGLLDPAEGGGLGEAVIRLQDALGAVHQLAGLQPLGEVRDLALQRLAQIDGLLGTP